jgi:cytochrome c oxidase assembly protein subunit 15
MSIPQTTVALRRVNRLALVTLALTLVLLCSGGLVTSHNVGMAVPDWPNTFGYNMFLFPVSGWIGGVFFEHTHRLWGSLIGLLTIILAVGLYRASVPRWVKMLGPVALVAVIAQGVLGGLRVTLIKDEIGIVHGCLAQAFFSLVGLICLVTSPWWQQASAAPQRTVERRWFWHVAGVCVVIFVQLALGATMRHAHMGLAIPDFPTAYGQVWPSTDQESLDRINDMRFRAGEMDTTAGQIHLQMTHRLLAVVIVCGIISAFVVLRRYPLAPKAIKRGAFYWMGLVFTQFILGMATIWSNKAADIATAHMAIGALTLLVGVILAAMAWIVSRPPLEQKTVTRATQPVRA